jgi:hypothetical protein
MGRQHRPPAANRGTPYTDGATGLLDPVARNLIRFIEIAIRFRRNRPDDPGPGNRPFLLKRRVPDRKFVIAVACLRNPASPVTTIGISNGWEGDVLDAVAGVGGRNGVGHSKSRSIRAAAA